MSRISGNVSLDFRIIQVRSLSTILNIFRNVSISKAVIANDEGCNHSQRRFPSIFAKDPPHPPPWASDGGEPLYHYLIERDIFNQSGIVILHIYPYRLTMSMNLVEYKESMEGYE